ncbi:hypothetical protein [Methanosarcina barkeri]|uniref:hypothetical protein n=1 Tax=Methanosarcina barkeri TaxID=2208 RepID=UPI001FB46447|nr:hypothetical protein [Methanosarcina barkeri]
MLPVALLIAHNTPATGYESSIYRSTPLIVWFILLLSTVCGVFIVLSQICDVKLGKYLWKIGLLIIYLCYITFISLFIIRGYYLWCMSGDPASHIGWIKQIILTSHVSKDIIYPILHIFSTQIYCISNINILLISKLLPLFFGILYVPFMYILSKIIFRDKREIILSTLASTTLVNSWYLNFTPNACANLYFPLVMFIILKVISVNDVRWEILVVIMAFMYPILHPVPILTCFVLISTLFLPGYIYAKKNTRSTAIKSRYSLRLKITLLFLLFVWSITWISSFYVWESTIRNINMLVSEGGPLKVTELASNINYAKGYGYNVTEQVLKKMGGSLLYVLVAIVSFPIVWKNKNKEYNNLFSLFGPLFIICFLILIIYFSNLPFDPLRMVTYTTTISTMFIGYLLYYFIKKIKTENKKTYIYGLIGLVFLLFIVWINTILTLYPSPYILGSNFQTTQSEVHGMNWLFENRNLDIEITGINFEPIRFGDLLLTSKQKKLQKLYWYIPRYLRIPYHFGYDNKSTLSNHYNQSLYMTINEKDKLIYKDVFPEMAEIRWIPSDFEKLNFDVSLDKIYSSKGVEVFYINGKK